MKGKDILNEAHDADKERFRKHLLWTKEQIQICADAAIKFQNKKKKYESEFAVLKTMSIEQWVEKHPKK